MLEKIGQKIHRHKFPPSFCLIVLLSLLLASCVSTPAVSRGKAGAKKPGRAQSGSPPAPDERAFLIARSRFGHKRYPDALKELRKFLGAYPKSRYRSRVLQMLGKVYSKTDDCTRALKTYKQLLQEDPAAATGQLRWQMGECYFALQDYRQSLVEYQLVLDRYPQSVEQERLLYKIGLAAERLGWLEQARSSLLRVGGYNLRPEEKITLFLARGRIGRKLKDYRTTWQAPLKALQVVEQETSLKAIRLGEQARAFVRESIAGHLPRVELERIAAAYPAKFPGGEALWRLARLEVEADRSEAALELLERFETAFSPQHPRYQEMQEMRTRLEEELRVDRHKIGVILPFSGRLAPFGQKVLQGIELAVEEENRRRQTKLALIIKDSQGKSTLAAKLMRELIEKERVIAVLGPVLSKVAREAARVANQLQTPLLTPAASAYGIPESGPYVFRNCLTSQQQVESIARFAVEEMGLRRFAVLAPDNPYGQELADIFAVIVEEELGGLLLAQLTYSPEDTDFRPQIEKLHTLPLQALFLPDYYDKIVQLAPQIAFYCPEGEEDALEKLIEQLPLQPEEEPLVPAKLLDWQPVPLFLGSRSFTRPGLTLPAKFREELPLIANFPKKLFLLGTHGWYNPQLLQEGDKFLEGAVFACGFFAQNPSPPVQDFLQKFRRRFWEEPDLLAAQAYDSANLVLETLRQGARTRQAVREGLAQLQDFAGLTGSGSFDQDGEMQKELAMVGIKRRRFRPLSGEEPWLHQFAEPSWAALLEEKDLEELLPWDLYHLLAPLELFEMAQPLEGEG